MILSIIIVNYNVEYFLHQCLKSIQSAKKNIELEVIVVDNNSVDNSVDMLKKKFPYVKLILNKINAGFSKANNQAIKIAKGEYILLLNPDTVVQEDTLIECVNFLKKNNDVGALGVKMIDGNGMFLPESKRSLPSPSSAFYKIFGLSYLFPNSKKFGKYHLNYINENKVNEVDVLSGAFLMTRKKVFDKIGLLDERFFMYGEDIDLSYRIQKEGYKNIYFPKTTIIHYKGESTKKTSINYIMIFYKAMILFVKKHYSNKNAQTLVLLINLAILLRASISIIKRVFLKVIQPIIDAFVMFFGMYYLKNLWEKIYFLNDDYFPALYLKYIVPVYIFFWLIGIQINDGHKRPFELKSIPKGILTGTIIMLLIYALIPENLRFSRALIILGAIWSIFGLTTTRYLLSYSKINFFKILKNENKRIAVISDNDEYKRIHEIINKNGSKIGFIGQIGVQNHNEKYLGHISQFDEIIKIYKINEIIFSSKDMHANTIIKILSNIKSSIQIKIAPSESTFIIGSNSNVYKDELYDFNHKKSKKRVIKTFFKKYIDFFS